MSVKPLLSHAASAAFSEFHRFTVSPGSKARLGSLPGQQLASISSFEVLGPRLLDMDKR